MITFSQLGEYGRFGNQLWQIASGIGIAAENLDNFVLYKEWKYQNYFKHRLPISKPNHLHRIEEQWPYYVKYNLSRTENWDLLGYFQSWKYFEHCKGTVRYYLEFDRPKSDGVAIHIRRGDYLNLQHIHPLPTVGYYSDAMQLFNGEHFTIFSDDLPWCKEHLKGYNISYYNSVGDDIADFKVMAGFDKFIIANSSYSWWAAWLGARDNKVVAPKNWVIGETRDDRVPPEWTRL